MKSASKVRSFAGSAGMDVSKKSTDGSPLASSDRSQGYRARIESCAFARC